MSTNLQQHEFNQALQMIEEENISDEEKVEMLLEIAKGIQQKPKSPKELHNAIKLYDKALEICPASEKLLKARVEAKKGTAYQAIPEPGSIFLDLALQQYESSIPVLNALGVPEEVAEAEMNLGLVLQTLFGLGKVPITECISAYQRSLKVFNSKKFPSEYAILHNNLATAFLSMPMTDERSKMREAMAVQSFETALDVVNLIDYPTEYAMLQNNLGNALQYASSSHPVENNIRALEAYDEALKVRTERDTPLEFANTICNKANCLRNIPDDFDNPEQGNRDNLIIAQTLYRNALTIFESSGDQAKANVVQEVLLEVAQDLGTGKSGSREGRGFGNARIT